LSTESPKQVLQKKFSSNPRKYYEVSLFKEKKFERKRCISCGEYFWTLDTGRTTCGDQPCEPYSFLGNPPTTKKFDYIETWTQTESFFKRHGHASVKRYPVVCRWRPDLFFTIASIIDFQRVEGGKVVFEVPANPLIVPQMCLRFNDVPNVGLSGRHNTCFCMIGQVSIYSKRNGYWKDKCIQLDFDLLTKALGIPPKEITFKEDVWLGYGAFGYSLQYNARGLELGNAVFTAYEGTPDSYKEMPHPVIDMGAGLERFAWITQGTPTAYEATFGPVSKKFFDTVGIERNTDFMLRYAKLSGLLNADEIGDLREPKEKIAKELGVSYYELQQITLPHEAAYAILDHTRSLLFAIVDGALPSNVGGGYNLRVILRRALTFIEKLGWSSVSLGEVAAWHADYLKRMYPELEEHYEDVQTILDVEVRKYQQAKERISKIVSSLKSSKQTIDSNKALQLYDSEGITPDILREHGLVVELPENFYSLITKKHEVQTHRAKEEFETEGLPATRLLFYEKQDRLEFKARVLRVLREAFVILDKTAFYPRSGGQEPDHGTLNGSSVIDVIKYGNIVLHKLETPTNIKKGEIVTGIVDKRRRNLIMRHHTATHIINGAVRRVVGPWVWQHSAFKDEDLGRLDFTHYASLTEEQIAKIESLANEVVLEDRPVVIQWMPRGKAEQEYSFRIYQGGVVPGREVRIVNIEGWDVEACGGTHCTSTGQVGLIKITKTERIQDGVDRIEYVSGLASLGLVREYERVIEDVSNELGASVDQADTLGAVAAELKRREEENRRLALQYQEKLAEARAHRVSPRDKVQNIGKVEFRFSYDEGLPSDYLIAEGEKATKSNPNLVYFGVAKRNGGVELVVFSGERAKESVSASDLAKSSASWIGGSAGGQPHFAQGGSKNPINSIDEFKHRLEVLVSDIQRKVHTGKIDKTGGSLD
jgi:alanyl-tRNA synthetase